MKEVEKRQLIEAVMLDFYQQKAVAPRLQEAIRYSIEAGGKRLRPLLLLEVIEAFGLEVTREHAKVAAAVELIHTGSLIHDDLPAMDNDDFRRGKPTNHKVFGEDLAILAGDSLFLDPFGLLASADLEASTLVSLIQELSTASGTFGMVAGQVLDMEGEQQSLDLAALETVHANKTGKLLTFPLVAGAILAQQGAAVVEKFRSIGEKMGLAFQIRDDILDVTASFEEMGKTPNKDIRAEKSTYTSLLGLDEAKRLLDDLLNQALSELEKLEHFSAVALVKLIERLRLDG